VFGAALVAVNALLLKRLKLGDTWGGRAAAPESAPEVAHESA